jgi:hypothetical protein
MKDLGILRFAPQFFEGFNFTHLAGQIWQYIVPYFQYGIYRRALPILRLIQLRIPAPKRANLA